MGGMVGVEREWRNQPAGFRTHLILCIGSCLMMLTSLFLADKLSSGDPLTIPAHVISGIGFLGAGAILRIGASVKGLTTSTSLWTVAGIGLAVGAGFYLGAVLTTCSIILALIVLRRVEKSLLGSREEQTIFLSCRDVPNIVGQVENILSKFPVLVNRIDLDKDPANRQVEVRATITNPQNINLLELTAALSSIKDISGVEIH